MTSTYNYAQDYGLTLDFAKRLAMMTRSERGEQARTYFLNCERIAMEAMAPNVPVLPQTYVQALESLLVTVKEKKELEAAHQAAQEKIVLMEPKAALFDKAMDSADSLSTWGRSSACSSFPTDAPRCSRSCATPRFRPGRIFPTSATGTYSRPSSGWSKTCLPEKMGRRTSPPKPS